MNNQEIKNKIKEIEDKIFAQIRKIEETECEILILRKQLFETKWKKISWKELEEWLKINRPENDYEKNPIVCDGFEFQRKTFCKLNKGEKLQIGAFSNTDFFEESRDSLYVTYDFESYRSNN